MTVNNRKQAYGKSKIYLSEGAKMKYQLVIFIALFTIISCANPLNQETSNRYADTCSQAEQNNQLELAEQSCYRALVNVDWGNLGESQKSIRLYNLGRIKRKLGKFDEAESLFKDSLEIEEKQTDPSKVKIGRRIAELALLHGEQGEIEVGLPYVERLLSISDLFVGVEQSPIATIFYGYSLELEKMGNIELAEKLSQEASALGYTE